MSEDGALRKEKRDDKEAKAETSQADVKTNIRTVLTTTNDAQEKPINSYL